MVSVTLPLIIIARIFCLSESNKRQTGEYRAVLPESSTVLKRSDVTGNMERDRLGQWGNGDNSCPSRTSGLERIRNPNLNKVIRLDLTATCASRSRLSSRLIAKILPVIHHACVTVLDGVSPKDVGHGLL